MAKEHHFTVNEKQLKHRFKKWNVRKYIPDSDTAAMLSFQRKRRAAGDQITFECRGHKVEEERLKRAAKRRKRSLPLDIVLTPYNTVSTSLGPQHSKERLDTARSETTGLDLGRISASQPSGTLADPYTNAQVSCISAVPGNDSEPTEATDEFEQRIERSPMIEESDVVIRAQGFDLNSRGLSLDWEHFNLNTTFFDEQTDRMAISRSPLIRQPTSCPESPILCDIDWSLFLELPSSRAPSAEQSRETIEPSQKMESASRALSGRSAATPIESTSDYEFIGRGHLLSIPMAPVDQCTNQAILDRVDIDAIMLPLQLLYSQYNACLENSSIKTWSFGEHTPRDFLAVAQSDWLCLEVEDLLCWAYEYAARSIRRRQLAKRELATNHCQNERLGSAQDDEGLVVERGGQGGGVVRTAKMPTKLKSNLCVESRSGMLRVHLRTPLAKRLPSDGPETLLLLFIPIANVRTTGITASFDRYSNGISTPQISRSIKTFNVVPQDSAIIQCVSRNDLVRVQGLFDRGEASPLDVDPYGFSLLSYAINSKDPEIFLLLLRGGANTQNCDHYGSALDIVWNIWFRYVDYMSHAKSTSGTTVPLIGDLNQCIRITDAVLDQGHDMEESVCYNADRASVLFEMNESLLLSEPDSRTASDILEFLINKGYDIEKRNYRGLTPFLHAVRSYKPQSLDCLKTFIRRGANVHARNKREQGALHIALAGPHRLWKWKSMRYRDCPGDNVADYHWTLQIVYQTDKQADDRDDGHWDTAKAPDTQAQSPVKVSSKFHHASEWVYQAEVPRRGPGSKDKAIEKIPCETDPRNTGLTDEIPEYILCNDYDGLEHLIPHPMKVLKTRLHYLLLTLLQAGCDPNVIDGDKETPSTYARRNDVWPQWCWALERSGYTYEVRHDRWVKVAVPVQH